jgi:hypothetical protein
MPMPVELGLRMDDGTTRRLTLPVEVWFGGNRYTTLVLGPRKVTGVIVDPQNFYPDVHRENNGWVAEDSSASTRRENSSR